MIVLDFDGTMVDVWERYYQVFMMAAKPVKNLTYDEYKKNKIIYESDFLLAKALNITLPHDYYTEKQRLLENPKLLNLDSPILTAKNFEMLSMFNNLLILTIRRSGPNLFQQVKNLGWVNLIPKIRVLPPKNQFSKYEYIKSLQFQGALYVIGDSETDFSIGKIKNSVVYAVSSGLRKCRQTEKNQILVKDINEALGIIREEKWNSGI